MDTIGKRLRTWRKEKGLSMPEISAKTGLSTGGLSAYERDEKLIGAKPLLALWSEFGLDIAWILTGKKDEDLTPEEQKLVDTFRSCNTVGQQLIQEHADSIREKLPANNQEQPAGVSTSAVG